MLRSFPTENDEASFIAYEINRMIAQTGGILSYGDFAVLRSFISTFWVSRRRRAYFLSLIVRFNALSRMVESALQREHIPNRILGGHKFFERAEVGTMPTNRKLSLTPLHRSRTYWPTFNWSTTPSSNLHSFALSIPLLEESAKRYLLYTWRITI